MFGYAFSVMSLGMFLGSPFFGKLAESFRSKVLMAWGCLGYALAQVLFAIGHTRHSSYGGVYWQDLPVDPFFWGLELYRQYLHR